MAADCIGAGPIGRRCGGFAGPAAVGSPGEAGSLGRAVGAVTGVGGCLRVSSGAMAAALAAAGLCSNPKMLSTRLTTLLPPELLIGVPAVSAFGWSSRG